MERKQGQSGGYTGVKVYHSTTVCKDRPHGHGGGLLVFIHESITFSKQPSSPEALSDPHLEELTINADIWNTKLIISNIYIPPASSCSNGYQSSIKHLLTTPDTIILGDVNAHHPSWYSTPSSPHAPGRPCQRLVRTIYQSSLDYR